MEKIQITTEFIKLDQLLKWANVVSSGSDAKHIITEEMVKVNGEIETRRGKKIRVGDIVEFDGKEIEVIA
ncbi:MAG: S4 domain-containing protein YaaA [Psychrilyobacter sp.]|uniref:S4 domain-containing protein YaaA n=1 Tax=Psychrilyobacter sp. TaxID=2586924 RepID=UPI003C727E5E